MSTKELAMSLFQDIYYDSKGRGDIKRAVEELFLGASNEENQ